MTLVHPIPNALVGAEAGSVLFRELEFLVPHVCGPIRLLLPLADRDPSASGARSILRHGRRDQSHMVLDFSVPESAPTGLGSDRLERMGFVPLLIAVAPLAAQESSTIDPKLGRPLDARYRRIAELLLKERAAKVARTKTPAAVRER